MVIKAKINKTCKTCGNHYAEVPKHAKPQYCFNGKEVIGWHFECHVCGDTTTMFVKTKDETIEDWVTL
jgi:hypothetical protein